MSAATHVYVIAEAGVNHNGRRELAMALVEAAAKAGADAVKFQTFDATSLVSSRAPKASYQSRNTAAGESQLSMLRGLELSADLHFELQAHARRHGIDFLSTAFDAVSVDLLAGMGLPRLKVASGDLTNAPLLWQIARTRAPLIISTGMATLSEVEQGIAVVAHALNSAAEPASMDEVWQSWSNEQWRKCLRGHVTLLHCTSLYPTPYNAVNLGAMDTLARAFALEVGYSDHSEGIVIAIAAVARGATIIEKHLTLDRNLPGPDHAASIEPDEFARMVLGIRCLTEALGDGRKSPQPGERDTRLAARQQVVAARDIAEGRAMSRDDLTTRRCGYGVSATELWSLVGRIAPRSFSAGEPLEGV